MDMALSKLNNGGWVHIFPEGSRSKDGGKTIAPAKRGVGRLGVYFLVLCYLQLLVNKACILHIRISFCDLWVSTLCSFSPLLGCTYLIPLFFSPYQIGNGCRQPTGCCPLCPYWDAGHNACWETYPKNRQKGVCPYMQLIFLVVMEFS